MNERRQPGLWSQANPAAKVTRYIPELATSGFGRAPAIDADKAYCYLPSSTRRFSSTPAASSEPRPMSNETVGRL